MSTLALALLTPIAAVCFALWLVAIGQALTHGARDWRDAHRRQRPGYLLDAIKANVEHPGNTLTDDAISDLLRRR